MRPVTEAQYEAKFAKALHQQGHFSYHTAERFYLGIPDRYVVGGRWIEFKQVKWIGTRPVSPIRQFNPGQIRTLDRLSKAGDDPWVALLFQTPAGDLASCFLPWAMFRTTKPQWTVKQVGERTRKWENTVEAACSQIEDSGFHNAHQA